MKRTKSHLDNINKLKAECEKVKNAKNALFKLDIESIAYTNNQVKEKLQENVAGINNTITKFKKSNYVEAFKNETSLIKRLNRKNLLKDCRADNVINVKKALKEAKCKFTKKMNEVEIELYKSFYTSQQAINEILIPSIEFLEKAWIKEENELNAISKNINKYVNTLDDENKNLIRRRKNNE